MKKSLFVLPLLVLASCGGGSSSSSSSSSLPSSSEEEGVYELLAPTGAVREYEGSAPTGTSYEIFVYSFADSNGDGIGDLQGIIDHLDYLQNLGVKNLWLTPIHPSSTYHKYNVRDYYSIDPAFGTVDDFVALCAAAKQKGIGITMDMVFNHSAKDHPWFEKAAHDFVYEVEGEDSYASLYSMGFDITDISGTKSSITVDGVPVYYECNFDTSMPEFNLDSPLAKKLHKEIMEYWLDKGASGFRFDGVAYYYLGDDAKCMEYLTYLNGVARAKKPDIHLVAEYWVNNQTMLNDVAPTGMTAFNFATSMSGVSANPLFAINSGNGRRVASAFAAAAQGFVNGSNGKTLPSFFLSNHDQDRWAANRSDAIIKLAASAYILTPGTPYLYYGEEIGLLGIRQNAQTDANRRLPMQWVANAEQDTARCVRSPESDYSGKQTSLGALEAIEDANSITHFYKDIIAFREETPAIQKGYFRNVTPDEAPFMAFRIDYQGHAYYLIHNVAKKETQIKVGSGLTLSSRWNGGSTYQDGSLTMPALSSAFLTIE